MTACVIRRFICVSVCRTLMPFRIAIRNLTVYLRYVDLRTVNFPTLAAFFFSRRDYSSPKRDDLDEFNLVRR